MLEGSHGYKIPKPYSDCMRDQKWHSISFAEIQKPAKEHMITITKDQDRKMGGAGGFGKKATN